jgi:type II secretory pathway component PulK
MRRDARGFALLATLWLIVALTAIVGVGVGIAQLGTLTTRNRIRLARAGWAREACVEILMARYLDDPSVRAVPRVELGRGTWCEARLTDPGAAVHANVADSGVLARLFEGEGVIPLLRPLLDRRATIPFADTAELRQGGGDPALLDRVLPMLTTRGTGQVNLNVASPAVLAALPGFGEEAARAVVQHRSLQPLQSLDEVLALVSVSARDGLLAAYPDLARTTTFAPTQLVAIIEGGVAGTPIVSRATLTMVPLPERLAVIRREVE